MPVDLTQIANPTADTASAGPKLTPKFFSSSLTGNGQNARGWLSNMADPEHVHPKHPSREDCDMVRRTVRQTQGGDSTCVRRLPLYFVPAARLNGHANNMEWMVPAADKLSNVGCTSSQSIQYYLDFNAHSIIMEETENKAQGVHEKRLTIFYRIGLWALDGRKTPKEGDLIPVLGRLTHQPNEVTFKFAEDVTKAVESMLSVVEKHGAHIDWDAAYDAIANVSAYETITDAAVLWNSDEAAKHVERMVDALTFTSGRLTNTDAKDLMLMLCAMEAYNMPLHVYMTIYDMLNSKIHADDMLTVCKVNLNLLLANTMTELEKMKPNLNQFSIPDPAPMIDPKYTREQTQAITSNEPLILTQAAAGTGKSSVVLERLQFMSACGVTPEDVTVLSFTNAAADHITELNPNVNSMTIAKMVHLIYSENYNHRLSTLETVRNALSIYLPKDPIAYVLRQRMFSVIKNDTGAFTELNLFVEQNFDKVIEMLDRIGQTTLELEIIVTYQNLDKMTEPDAVSCKHLIIDEVQDCSIFEFIFALDYIRKHKNSMFIVGGSSLT